MTEPNTNWDELERGVQRPAGQRHTFVVKRTRVTVIEVDDLSFHFNSAVLLPAAQIADSGNATKPVLGLKVIKVALEQGSGEGGHVLVVGHTDSVGTDAVNIRVSQARADNVLAYLKGDRDAWAKACELNVVRDVQAILAFIDRTFHFDCDPGVVDGLWGQNSRGALQRFRRRFNDEKGGSLPASGPLGSKDWKAFFDMYEEGLALELGCEVSALAGKRSALVFLDPATLACGEHWPVEAKHKDNVRSASNRRVEISFFEDSDVPAFADEVPPGKSLFLDGRRFRREYVDIVGDVIPFALALTLDGEPRTNLDYVLTVDGQKLSGNTGGGGMVEQEIPRQAQRAKLELLATGEVIALRLTQGLADGSELRGVQRRLQSLSYYEGELHGELDDLTRAGLRAFQHENDLEVTGEADGATQSKLQEIFGS